MIAYVVYNPQNKMYLKKEVVFSVWTNDLTQTVLFNNREDAIKSYGLRVMNIDKPDTVLVKKLSFNTEIVAKVDNNNDEVSDVVAAVRSDGKKIIKPSHQRKTYKQLKVTTDTNQLTMFKLRQE